MPVGKELDRHHAGAQHDRKRALMDPDETIQSKLPVENGEVILTQTRLYLATGEREGPLPNVRLERSRPQVVEEDEWLEIAPRMGAFLLKGQNGREFLGMVDELRRRSLERLEARARPSREGIRRRYDSIVAKARAHGDAGDRRKMKDTLRTLHAAAPERHDAAEQLGTAYLDEGNARAAAVWLARAGTFDERFDRALARVERPRLPSREQPPPEVWLDRHLIPLAKEKEGPGPTEEQRRRILAARQRVVDHRAASGRAGPLAVLVFVLVVVLWFTLMLLKPWPTLGVTAAAAMAVGLMALWRDRGRKKKRPH
jgi:hypothetical protein